MAWHHTGFRRELLEELRDRILHELCIGLTVAQLRVRLATPYQLIELGIHERDRQRPIGDLRRGRLRVAAAVAAPRRPIAVAGARGGVLRLLRQVDAVDEDQLRIGVRPGEALCRERRRKRLPEARLRERGVWKCVVLEIPGLVLGEVDRGVSVGVHLQRAARAERGRRREDADNPYERPPHILRSVRHVCSPLLVDHGSPR